MVIRGKIGHPGRIRRGQEGWETFTSRRATGVKKVPEPSSPGGVKRASLRERRTFLEEDPIKLKTRGESCCMSLLFNSASLIPHLGDKIIGGIQQKGLQTALKLSDGSLYMEASEALTAKFDQQQAVVDSTYRILNEYDGHNFFPTQLRSFIS